MLGGLMIAKQNAAAQKWYQTLVPYIKAEFDSMHATLAVLGFRPAPAPLTVAWRYKTLNTEGLSRTDAVAVTLLPRLCPARAEYMLEYRPYTGGPSMTRTRQQYAKLTGTKSLMCDLIIITEGMTCGE